MVYVIKRVITQNVSMMRETASKKLAFVLKNVAELGLMMDNAILIALCLSVTLIIMTVKVILHLVHFLMYGI